MNDQSLAKRLATAAGAFVLVASITAGAAACSSTSDDAPPEHDGATPEEVVARYFEAIQAGDAAAALGCLEPLGPDARGLLTDAVLQEAQRLAPVSDVEIPDYDNYASMDRTFGTVTYTVGGQPVEANIGLEWRFGQWLIWPIHSLGGIYLPPIVSGYPTVTVNGVGDLAGEVSVWAFPGGYQFDTGNPLVAYDTGDSPYIVFGRTGPGVIYAYGTKIMVQDDASQQPSIIVTEAAQAAAVAAAEDKVEECLELGSDALAKCGFRVSREGDGSWAVTEGDPSQWEFKPALGTTRVWASNLPGGVGATCTDSAGEYCGHAWVRSAIVDLSDPDNLTVILHQDPDPYGYGL
ncbi:MAG: hypothetical protein LBR27_02635 [Bifidobacteriaceae bacterium]|jgi:hypothetical protein|nr:hypothetical protein [Bifidobacteriaceae bacterium]